MFEKIHKNLFKGLFVGGLIVALLTLGVFVALFLLDVAFYNAGFGVHFPYIVLIVLSIVVSLLGKKLSYVEADNEQLFNACNEIIMNLNRIEAEGVSAAPAKNSAVKELEERVEELEEKIAALSAKKAAPVAKKEVATADVDDEPVKKTVAKKPAAKKSTAKSDDDVAALTKQVAKLNMQVANLNTKSTKK